MSKRLVYPIVFMVALGAVAVQGQDVEWIRAAYWDGRYPTAWGGGGEATRDALQAAGYEILDADQLKTWMDARIADRAYSVVVFCRDVVPDTVVETQSATCTLRKYLDAGGKIVWYADIPFYYWGHADGNMDTWADAGAPAVLGFDTSSGARDSGQTATFTPAGITWGLTETWTSQRPLAPSVTTNVTILATDDNGNAPAWAKHYVTKDKFRGFVRFRDTSGEPIVEDIMRLAEYVSFKASNPSPADGAPGVSLPLFTWESGSFAIWHDLYLGTSPELTDADKIGTRLMWTTHWHQPGLIPGTTYYWRVDEIAADETVTTGDVWSFTATPLTAFLPDPADDAENVLFNPTLSWMAGLNTLTHHVYFGADRSAVEAGAPETDRGELSAGETSYEVSETLKPDTTYYWRVDETDVTDAVQTGAVWSFSTLPGGPTGAIRQWWSNIGGTDIPSLTGNPNFPDNPSGQELVALMEGPVDWSDNYGTRLYGWLYPAQTGDYTFWISGDDNCELWLSTDADPANAQLIATVTDWTESREWNKEANQQSAAVPLTAGQKYYIEALAKEGTGGDNIAVAWQGPGFAMEVIGTGGVGPTPFLPVRAYDPYPADEAVDTPQDLILEWSAGAKAQQHEVYLGNDADAVAAADSSSPLFMARQAGTSFDAGALEWGKTYFWRVDEINDGDPESPWIGRVWSFSTADYIPVDDFEGYSDDFENADAIWEVWIDGLTNLTGSIVGYFSAPFTEQTIVHGGSQSMPFDFNNVVSPYYSEVELPLSPAQDWTVEGLTDLSLWVRGYPAPVSVDVTETGGKMTLTGDGADIWENSDEFTYAYKTLNGNGSIVARVVSIGPGTNTWAKGGVMIRDSLDGGSTHAMTVMTANSDGTAGNGASFQYRLVADGVSANSDAVTVVAPPYWVKIERLGDGLTGYLSIDGQNWTLQGSTQYITMPAPVYIGICVTSHEVGEDRTFEFDNIQTSGAVSGAWQGAIISAPRHNAAQNLYVFVEEGSRKSAIATNPDLVNSDVWTEWRIPLSSLTGVNPAKVSRLYIGVGDRDNPTPDGAGLIFIDDIRVAKPAAVE